MSSPFLIPNLPRLVSGADPRTNVTVPVNSDVAITSV